jgi:hypothetical protein
MVDNEEYFLNTETKVPCVREVLAPQLILFHFQPTLQDFLRLGTTNGNVHGDLFVTTDTKCTDGVTCF